MKPEEGTPEDPGELPAFFMGSAQTHLSVPYEDKLNSRTASSPNWYSSGVNCTVWFGSALLKKEKKISILVREKNPDCIRVQLLL